MAPNSKTLSQIFSRNLPATSTTAKFRFAKDSILPKIAFSRNRPLHGHYKSQKVARRNLRNSKKQKPHFTTTSKKMATAAAKKTGNKNSKSQKATKSALRTFLLYKVRCEPCTVRVGRMRKNAAKLPRGMCAKCLRHIASGVCKNF